MPSLPRLPEQVDLHRPAPATMTAMGENFRQNYAISRSLCARIGESAMSDAELLDACRFAFPLL